MTEINNSKLEFAKRRNKRKRKFKELCSELSENKNFEWIKDERVLHDLRDSVDLDELLYQRILSLRRSKDLIVNEGLDEHSFLKCTIEFLAQIESSLIYLFMSNWRSIGAIKVPASKLSKCALDLLYVDGDTLYGCTKNMKKIFVFDFFNEADAANYECSYWTDMNQ